MENFTTNFLSLRNPIFGIRTFFCLISLFFLSFSGYSQFQITGKITDAEDGKPLPGATVVLENSLRGTVGNTHGEFVLKGLKKGNYSIKITFLGFEKFQKNIDLNQDVRLEVVLKRSTFVADEVVVNATRANEKSGMAYSNVSREDLQKQNVGQDIPQLLNFATSLVTTSDAGAGVGYTGIRIRGTDATRINVTVNGIPMNDSESQGLYWVNMPDIASSTSSVQIQRGVGTSTNGAGAFGGSVNLQTNDLKKEAYAQINSSIGSFKTIKNTVSVGSGLINDKFTFDARLSKITSDGYVDRASSDLKSFYLSGAYFGKKSFVRLNVFSGTEKTYQSWNGVPEYLLATDRTYNSFTYNNQTDNYQQDHYQLLTSHTLSPNLTFNVNLHYTKGKGYYEEYKENQKFSGYGLPDIQIKDSTIKSTDLIRRKWLDNDFYGTTFSLDYQSFRKLSATIGGGWNKYNGNHYGEIIWAKYASASNIGYRWYESNSKKTDFNIYAKINYQLAEILNAFVDLQGRFIAYDMKGTAKDRQDITQSSEYQFFNPKFGLTLDLDAFSHVYASYSIGNKEPSRQDFIDNTPKRPLAEKLGDVELGYKLQRGKFAFGLNGYYMDYTNQLVLTGKVNDVGEAIRLNVPESYRLGIEVEAGAQLTSTLKINANATFSKNKIKNFTETLPNYDDGGVEKENKYAETDISFSPNVIFGSQILYTPLKGLEFGLLSKYVGKQYLDNTTNESRKLNSYFTNDIRAIYSLKGKALKNVTLTALVNNVFNTLYESNGYSYSYIYEGKVATENFYFPQAGTNVLFGISLKF